MLKLSLPPVFSFYENGYCDFNKVLSFFDWDIKGDVEIDLTTCKRANYQALSLVILYCFYLSARGSHVEITLEKRQEGSPSTMWRKMGAHQWCNVLTQGGNFNSDRYKPLFALRNTSFKDAISNVEMYTKSLGIEYEKTLRYVMAELFYNAIEHGTSILRKDNCLLPPIVQYVWYQKRNEIQFIIADLGVGIKKHLEQSCPAFGSHCEAILHSIRPGVSGTFGKNDPYISKDNAGMGLYISNNIVRRLHSEMYIVSNNGAVHISPADITHKTLDSTWPGTFALVSVKLQRNPSFVYESTLSELRTAAEHEVLQKDSENADGLFYVNIYNYFGRNAEEKSEAIRFRDKYIVPAIDEGKQIKLDFSEVVSSPHSFLNALLATPATRLGIKVYKMIKIVNADTEIRETIDYIFDENTKLE